MLKSLKVLNAEIIPVILEYERFFNYIGWDILLLLLAELGIAQ